MDKQKQRQQQMRNNLIAFGFDIKKINQAIQVCPDQQSAVEYILKLQQQQQWQDVKQDKKKKYQQVKMVILCRTDLKMGVGKIAAQTGHAVRAAAGKVQQLAKISVEFKTVLQQWSDKGQKMVVLQVKNKQQMMQLVFKCKQAKIVAQTIMDAGLTQVQPGTITVAGIGPWWSQKINQITGQLKLL